MQPSAAVLGKLRRLDRRLRLEPAPGGMWQLVHEDGYGVRVVVIRRLRALHPERLAEEIWRRSPWLQNLSHRQWAREMDEHNAALEAARNKMDPGVHEAAWDRMRYYQTKRGKAKFREEVMRARRSREDPKVRILKDMAFARVFGSNA